MDDFAYGCFIPNISYCDNYFYSLYKSANEEKDFGMAKCELYNIIIRHFLHDLKTNK